MTAKYDAVQVPGPLSESIDSPTNEHLIFFHSGIPFSLFEEQLNGEPRLFFTRRDNGDTQAEGVFTFQGPNITTEQTVIVYAEVGYKCVLTMYVGMAVKQFQHRPLYAATYIPNFLANTYRR